MVQVTPEICVVGTALVAVRTAGGADYKLEEVAGKGSQEIIHRGWVPQGFNPALHA
ncbi:MAG: hypothetical protein ACE5IC_06265 [Candidatus Brocadiales bacterium]